MFLIFFDQFDIEIICRKAPTAKYCAKRENELTVKYTIFVLLKLLANIVFLRIKAHIPNATNTFSLGHFAILVPILVYTS